jgi:molybdenum cofactor cytidylyltransferase
MDRKPKLAILILAAGESSRMGEHVKQILPWRSTTLLGNAIQQADTSIADNTFTVLGAFEERIMAEVNFEANSTIKNSNWGSGMGSSIATGISHFLTKGMGYDAVLIMLADQPLIDTNYLNKMMGNWIGNPSKIITTQYDNKSGVPAIFGKEHFEELQTLNKDFGAKDIIVANEATVLALNPEGKEIDIDSWETYQELLNKKVK